MSFDPLTASGANYTATAVWEMSSDAAKSGTRDPALAGHMHGATWRAPLAPTDVAGPRQLPIPVLELAAVVINFIIFGPRIPDGVTLKVMSDSLTSVDVLADAAAHAPLMQWLHRRLLDHAEFRDFYPKLVQYLGCVEPQRASRRA